MLLFPMSIENNLVQPMMLKNKEFFDKLMEDEEVVEAGCISNVIEGCHENQDIFFMLSQLTFAYNNISSDNTDCEFWITCLIRDAAEIAAVLFDAITYDRKNLPINDYSESDLHDMLGSIEEDIVEPE